MVEELLRAGADVDARNVLGEAALSICLATRWGLLRCGKKMITKLSCTPLPRDGTRWGLLLLVHLGLFLLYTKIYGFCIFFYCI